jgi:hypothetical protein
MFAELVELGVVIIGIGLVWMVVTVGMLVWGSILMKIEEIFL